MGTGAILLKCQRVTNFDFGHQIVGNNNTITVTINGFILTASFYASLRVAINDTESTVYGLRVHHSYYGCMLEIVYSVEYFRIVNAGSQYCILSMPIVWPIC